MTGRRPRTFGGVVVVLVALVGCGDGDGSGAVAIEVDRHSGSSFVVTQDPDRRFCDGGVARAIDYSDLDGGEIPIWELAERSERRLMAVPPDVTVDYLLTFELDCSDGSGSFTMTQEDRNGGAWEVVGGTGAYDGIVGGGTLTVDRDPPTEHWHPPGGVPHFTRLTGELRVPPDRGDD